MRARADVYELFLSAIGLDSLNNGIVQKSSKSRVEINMPPPVLTLRDAQLAFPRGSALRADTNEPHHPPTIPITAHTSHVVHMI